MRTLPMSTLVSIFITIFITGALAGGLALTASANSAWQSNKKEKPLQLGNFSVSLAVKDLKASKEFYEKLDFKQVGGDAKQNWIVLQNGTTTIGLFQGMFKKNIMTFNPGWDKDKKTLKKFQDVRELQSVLKKRGLTPATPADEKSNGPANFVLVDPDGNPILFDQHVERPKK